MNKKLILGLVGLLPLLSLQAAEFSAPGGPNLKSTQDEVNKALAANISDYKKDLEMLLREYQKAGDLDAFLGIREEIARFEKNPQIPATAMVKEPEMLAILQGNHRLASLSKTNEIVKKNTGTLLARQRSLTREGKIEEALAVRNVIRSIQSAYKESLDWAVSEDALPSVYSVNARSLIMGFTKMEEVAKRLFVERRLLVEGIVHGFDADFSDGTQFNVYIKDAEDSETKVQFAFKSTDVEVKRSRPQGVETATFTKKGDKTKGPFVMKAGIQMRLEGRCAGKHINVNMVNAMIPDSYWPVALPAAE